LDQSESGWDLRREALLELQDWELYGRVSVTLEEQGWHANLDWIQQGPRFQLDLSGPLRQGRLVITGGPDGVRAQGGDGQVAFAEDAETLIARQLGWTLPVLGLRYWVRGIPDPSQPVIEMSLDELGRLATLKQGGWTIRYPDYLEGDGLDLPHKIRLDSSKINVRMVVDQWVQTRAISWRRNGAALLDFRDDRFSALSS
jgi:outer membrane lipoprotein LolB